jgi:hypothetical protein
MGKHAERREASRAEKLAKLQAQIDNGSLTIRQATPAEREAWAARGPTRSNSSGSGSANAGGSLSACEPDPNLEDGDGG